MCLCGGVVLANYSGFELLMICISDYEYKLVFKKKRSGTVESKLHKFLNEKKKMFLNKGMKNL